MSTTGKPIVLVVHGGAGALPDSSVAPATAGCARAAAAGYAVLSTGGSAVAAVEAAVRVLEDDTTFNAGTGSCLTEEGTVRCDAAVQSGETLAAGCVTGVSSVKNPVSLARALLEKGPHVFLAGPSADVYAASAGLEVAPPGSLVTQKRKDQLARLQRKAAAGAATDARDLDGGAVAPDDPVAGQRDTVGAVALDAAGHVAAATSTGGIAGKSVGRVGDAPVLGAGTAADDNIGAVSCTGTGELLMRFGLAHRVLNEFQSGAGEGAVGNALHALAVRLPDADSEGAIAVTPSGVVSVSHTSPRMSWAVHRGVVGGEGGEVVESGVVWR